MNQRCKVTLGMAGVVVALALGAAPAARTYLDLERTVKRVRDSWSGPGAKSYPNAPAWNAFFDALTAELRQYAEARNEVERLQALDRLYRRRLALQGVTWRPASELHAELRDWLRPRVALAWAERNLEDTLRGMPTAAGRRDQWLEFLERGLLGPIREYEGARTVEQRLDALKRVYGSIQGLRELNQSRPWQPSLALEASLNSAFNRHNLDIQADANSVSPALSADVVQSGPIFFKGNWSFVTAGPKTGFGLLYSDDGIAFYNSQMLTSVTPISSFQQQLSQDRRGRRAAKLYYFDATSVDNSELTITAVLRDTGLSLFPGYQHNVGATIGSLPIKGKGLGRGIASLIGLNQAKITQKVWEGAIGKIQQGVVEGAAELGSIRTNEEAGKRNAQYSNFLRGNHTLVYSNLLINGLTLASRPWAIMVGGVVEWLNAREQVGAYTPQPASFNTLQPGVVVDVHLPTIMTNLSRGFLQSQYQNVKNLMIVTEKVPPNSPPGAGVKVTQNADFEAFTKAVETARAANDPKVMAVRIKRPGRSPEFGADARGRLVALVYDFSLEVPNPNYRPGGGGGLLGPPARVYRISAPQAEFDISFKVTPAQKNIPIRLAGRIEEFDPGEGAQVFAVNEDESKAVPLTRISSNLVLFALGQKLRGQPVDIPLSQVNLRKFALHSVSDLDPSGWMRIVLSPSP